MKRLILLALCVGCSSSPANVAGDYTVAGTDRTNGCNFQNWMEGNTFNADVTITQNGSSATATVNGAAGLALDLLLGTHTFTGSVDGNAIKLTATGTRANTSGNCTYTYNSEIDATLTGDTLTGKINYRAATNNNSDCATIQGCTSYQDFNGTRPPM